MERPLDIGNTYITNGAIAEVSYPEVLTALARHARGDWGDLCEVDKKANDDAAANGDGRLFSSYKTKRGTKFWVITEADRSLTTILLPDEY